MDIGKDLSYNVNTVRGGDFPEEQGSEREYMQRKISILIMCALFLLGGCTSREQLVFESDQGPTETGQEQTENDAPKENDIGETGEVSVQEQTGGTVEPEPESIYIHVCGAVSDPGVYELQSGDRVYEAVEKAGGFTAEADQNYVNQAKLLQDGVRLYIPTVEESAEMGILMQGEDSFSESGDSSDPSQESTTQDGKVNINTASEAELCTIPGIGATRAQAILSYREQHGAFGKVEDIMNVSGIKEGTYEKIKDFIKTK